MDEEILVHYYTIHYIDKEAQKTTAAIDLSKNILGADEFSDTLISQVHKAINDSPSLKNISFKENASNIFTNTLEDYFSTSIKEDFYTFTTSLTDLKDKIEKESFSTGGYYLFADYTINGKRYISVTLLRKKSGLNITKVQDSYKVNTAENINIDKIAMAFRLNYSIYSSVGDDRNYLALITTQQNGIVSGYFRDWVSAGEYIKNDKNTENLVKIIKYIDMPKDENGKDVYKTYGDFQKAIYEYARPRKNRIINLRDMGKHFYGEENETAFIDFAEENGLIIDPEFKRDSTKWRGLVTIRAKVDGVELNVDFNKINDIDVILEENRIIINSKKLIAQVTKQYKENEQQ